MATRRGAAAAAMVRWGWAPSEVLFLTYSIIHATATIFTARPEKPRIHPNNLRVPVTSRRGRPHRSHSFGHFFMMSFILQMHFKVLHRLARSNCIDLARTATTTDKLSLPFGPVRNMTSGSTHHATHLILHADASSAPGCRPLYSNSYFSPGCVLCMWSKSDCNHAGGSCGKQVPGGQGPRNEPSRNDWH
jgi:hypothetical protein